MSVAYTASQVSGGLHVGLGTTDTFTSVSLSPLSAAVTLSAAATTVGQTVNVTSTAYNGIATYEGYFTIGTAVYSVYAEGSSTGTGGSGIGAFAVSTTGAVLTAGLLETLNTNPVCFLRGTLIATKTGEVPIETLRLGDLVATVAQGGVAHLPVRWIGSRKVRVDPQGTPDHLPVRVRAGAVRGGIPARDLLVTSEHCLHLDGQLVPARMLVNGGSILVDRGITDYEYFHVELDRHAILLAEGMEAESYLDTGNRGNFTRSSDGAVVVSLVPDVSVQPTHQSWAEHAAAPLGVDRETVEPIWNRLNLRSHAMGFVAPIIDRLGQDGSLCLSTDSGLEIMPSLFDGRVYGFVVPAGTGSLRLRSPAMRPSEAIGPFVDDRRAFGVLVGAIGVSIGRHPGQEAALPGWHGIERGSPYRWTDGDALLPVALQEGGLDPVFVDIEVAQLGPYAARRAA